MTPQSSSPPATYGNPFDVSGPYAALMRLALALALLPGVGMGLVMVLVFGLGLPWSAPWPILAQGHGQIQALGFTPLFVVAVGLQLFPRFLGAPLLHARRATWGGALLAAGLVVRIVAQPLEPGLLRGISLVAAAVAVPVGLGVAGSAFHGLSRRSVQPKDGPSAAWRAFLGVGGTALGGALVLSVWSTLQLAAGDLVVPPAVDEAIIHLELAGFATCLPLAVSSRILGRFLLLRTRPALERSLPRLALIYGAGLAATVVGWLIEGGAGVWLRFAGSLVLLGVVAVWLWLIGLYGPPSRPSGTPYVTEPTRRWTRFAFAFLLLSFAVEVWLTGREALLGLPPTLTALSAARHALAQGFLLPLMVAMAARLLPIYSADVLKHRGRLEITVDLMLVGALLRVGAELLGGYQGPAGPLVSLGGTLSVVGFALFAVGLWSSLGRLPKPRTVPSS
jgi:hypothetical protein